MVESDIAARFCIIYINKETAQEFQSSYAVFVALQDGLEPTTP